MLLYIMRHGETNYNVAGRMQGWIDQPLNDNGKALAAITGENLSDVHFDIAISSPLSRAYETAQIILKNSGNGTVEIITDERIKELSFGKWEGLCSAKDNYEIPCDNFDIFFEDPFKLKPFPDGENVEMLCKRTGEFYQDLIHNEKYFDKTILVSTHGCAMRGILHQVYEDKNNFWHTHVPYNCEINIIEVVDGKSRIIAEDIVYYDRDLCVDRYK